MADRIIDARNRFREMQSSPETALQVTDQWKERSLRQQREATELREKLISTARIKPADRRILARNLGRAIERKSQGNPPIFDGDQP